MAYSFLWIISYMKTLSDNHFITQASKKGVQAAHFAPPRIPDRIFPDMTGPEVRVTVPERQVLTGDVQTA